MESILDCMADWADTVGCTAVASEASEASEDSVDTEDLDMEHTVDSAQWECTVRTRIIGASEF